jgi:hypothetical protein
MGNGLEKGREGSNMGNGDEEDEEGEEDEEDNLAKSSKSSKKQKDLLERLDAIPIAIEQIAGTNPPLSRLFNLHFGAGAVVDRIIPPSVYKHFFFQVSLSI